MATFGGSERVAPLDVSIHATLAGGDNSRITEVIFAFPFLSTPPSRVATNGVTVEDESQDVSIHATLAGGDDNMDDGQKQAIVFLSTPPSRVATQ